MRHGPPLFFPETGESDHEAVRLQKQIPREIL